MEVKVEDLWVWNNKSASIVYTNLFAGAAVKPRTKVFGKTNVVLNRGQIFVDAHSFANEIQIRYTILMKMLARMEKTGIIRIKEIKKAKYIVTIVNYNQYMSKN